MSHDRASEIAQHFVETFFPAHRGLSQEAIGKAVAVEMIDHFPDESEETFLKAMAIMNEIMVADEAFDDRKAC